MNILQPLSKLSYIHLGQIRLSLLLKEPAILKRIKKDHEISKDAYYQG